MNLKSADFTRSQRDLGNLLIYHDDEYTEQYIDMYAMQFIRTPSFKLSPLNKASPLFNNFDI